MWSYYYNDSFAVEPALEYQHQVCELRPEIFSCEFRSTHFEGNSLLLDNHLL